MQKPTVLTVRNLPPDVATAVARRAREKGQSLNRAAIELMRDGIAPRSGAVRGPRKVVRHEDLDDLIGAWSRREQTDFDRVLRAQRTVDPKDWR